MALMILKKNLNTFLDSIIKEYPTYGPTEDKEDLKSRFRFKKLQNGSDFFFGYGPTIIPPKKYLFPARDEIFKFEGGEILPPTNKEFVVFGVNQKDGEGLYRLDQVYEYPIVESHYQNRRKNMHLIIVDTLSPSNSINCDLYLQLVDESHIQAYPFTEFGESLVTGNQLFGHQGDTGALSSKHLPDNVVFHPRLPEIIENSRNHPVWKNLAKSCFNCGICSYVCPLCYCYEETDEIKISKNTAKDMKGTRVRRWDSCMLPEFAGVTFHNFRPNLEDRIYNWYYHKFVRMPREVGFVGCVDCGRCIIYCPAKINYRKVLERLIEDDRK
jgi:sulfhydrogenase subunit beta (sulfur reductase)